MHYEDILIYLHGYDIFFDFFGYFFNNIVLIFQVSPKDCLPAIICKKCREQLDTCHRFREEAQRTQRKLQNFLQFANKLTGSPQVLTHKCFFFFTFGFIASFLYIYKVASFVSVNKL